MNYQIHKTLVHIDGAVGELDPIIRPGKLDVHTQVQGERFRVDLIGIRCCFCIDC